MRIKRRVLIIRGFLKSQVRLGFILGSILEKALSWSFFYTICESLRNSFINTFVSSWMNHLTEEKEVASEGFVIVEVSLINSDKLQVFLLKKFGLIIFSSP